MQSRREHELDPKSPLDRAHDSGAAE
jgi:hypothetical protein